MRFHVQSFLHYFNALLPYDVSFCHHDYLVFVFPPYPMRQDVLRDMVTEATLKAVSCPMGTPLSTEQESVFVEPPDAHLETLEGTLKGTVGFLVPCTFSKPPKSERGGFWELEHSYRIDLKVIEHIIRQVRLQEDVKLIRDFLPHVKFLSVRGVQTVMYSRTGYKWSSRRVTDALNEMEKQGDVKRGRALKSKGRQVIPKQHKGAMGKVRALFA